MPLRSSLSRNETALPYSLRTSMSLSESSVSSSFSWTGIGMIPRSANFSFRGASDCLFLGRGWRLVVTLRFLEGCSIKFYILPLSVKEGKYLRGRRGRSFPFGLHDCQEVRTEIELFQIGTRFMTSAFIQLSSWHQYGRCASANRSCSAPTSSCAAQHPHDSLQGSQNQETPSTLCTAPSSSPSQWNRRGTCAFRQTHPFYSNTLIKVAQPKPHQDLMKEIGSGPRADSDDCREFMQGIRTVVGFPCKCNAPSTKFNSTLIYHQLRKWAIFLKVSMFFSWPL